MDPRTDPRLLALQQRLGHRFASPALLARALTHRSFSTEHNERLEFLGDAVLATAVSSLLYERFAASDEGALSRMRAHLVREDSLYRVAQAVGLPELLRVSEGEARGGLAQRPSLLADALEAVIGAVHLDGGYAAASEAVRRLFGELLQGAETDTWIKDAKTELQEWLQARRLPIPQYRIVATRGQAHAKTFVVECSVPSLSLAESGEGLKRQDAEKEAARRILEQLKAGDRPGGPLRS